MARLPSISWLHSKWQTEEVAEHIFSDFIIDCERFFVKRRSHCCVLKPLGMETFSALHWHCMCVGVMSTQGGPEMKCAKRGEHILSKVHRTRSAAAFLGNTLLALPPPPSTKFNSALQQMAVWRDTERA